MKTQEFKQILTEVKSMDIPSESAVSVAQVILQESGKDKRAEICNRNRYNNGFKGEIKNGNQPATEPQKYTLKKHGVKFSDDITKTEASALLDKVMPKLDSNAKGKPATARPF